MNLLKSEFKNDFGAVRKRILNATLPLAYCRFTSESRNLRLYFKALRLEQFVNLDDLAVDEDALFADLLSRSATSCPIAKLKAYITAEVANSHDPYQLASGHDVASMLGLALRKLLANRREVQTWGREIEAGLRLAFDWEALAGTALFSCLKRWESNNKPYRIFRQQLA
jgi:hypothetical protein